MKQRIYAVGLLALLLFGFSTSLVSSDQRLGVSYPDYGEIHVLPNTPFSGTFTVFNQGSENVTAYAEIRGSPGSVTIEWAIPKPTGGDLDWIKTMEANITTGAYKYARFTIMLGELVQGQWYNWSIVVGYIDYNPSTHAVAANGIRLNMIWPKPPEWYELVPWGLMIIIGVIGVGGGYVGWRFRRSYQKLGIYEHGQEKEIKKIVDNKN